MMDDLLAQRVGRRIQLIPALLEATRRGLLTLEQLQQELTDLGLPPHIVEQFVEAERLRLLGRRTR